ncbi:MAG: hypothetical protein AABX64_03315 [Nanoarchaeota archaeon]
MDYCNFIVNGKVWEFVSEDYEKYKNAANKGLIIHWLPADKKLPKIEVVLDDGTVVSGWGEKNLENAREGDIVQLERMYFARLDKKGDKKGKDTTFYYLHS